METRSGEPSRPRVEAARPAEIPLPDFSPFREKEYSRREVHRFPFPGHEADLTGVLVYEFSDDRPDVNVRLSAESPEGEQILVFNSKIRGTDRLARADERLNPESGSEMHAIVYTRKVDEDYRKRGLGTAALQILEQTLRRIGDAKPEIRPRWMEIYTGLASTSNLAIDPVWLYRWMEDNYETLDYDRLNRLLDRANNTAVNLGFVPAPGQERHAIMILTNRATGLDDKPGHQKDVLLYKKLDPNLAIKPPEPSWY